MADVTLSYKGSDILELSNSGSATLKTGGTYCEGDIAVEYVKPSGVGNNYIDLSDSTLWENKDFSTASAVGTSYDNTRSSSSTRISLKEPIAIHDVFVLFKASISYDWYFVMFDEDKNYIGWASNSWVTNKEIVLLSTTSFRQATGSMELSSAKYVGVSCRVGSTNPNISPSVALTINNRIVFAEVTA